MFLFFFFFKQKTAYEMRISDWSSDVCSSDLSDRPERALSNLCESARFRRLCVLREARGARCGARVAPLHHCRIRRALASTAMLCRVVRADMDQRSHFFRCSPSVAAPIFDSNWEDRKNDVEAKRGVVRVNDG